MKHCNHCSNIKVTTVFDSYGKDVIKMVTEIMSLKG